MPSIRPKNSPPKRACALPFDSSRLVRCDSCGTSCAANFAFVIDHDDERQSACTDCARRALLKYSMRAALDEAQENLTIRPMRTVHADENV